jgi:GNAT superfamily N-acetyltransferase
MASALARAVDVTTSSGAEHIPQLIELSRVVYGAHPDMTSEAYYRWLYAEGPAGPAIRVCAFADGRMVGHYAVVPLSFSDNDREIRAGQGVDAIVHPAEQGRGLFARLVSAADAAAGAAGVELLYVIPGPQSEPWFTTVLRYVRDGELSFFVEPLRSAALLQRGPALLRLLGAAGVLVDPLLGLRSRFVNRRRSCPSLRIEPTARFGPEFDDLWMRIRGSAGRTTDRTAAYLNWRYVACPTRRYRILTAWSGPRVVGYVVSRSRTVPQYPGIRLGAIVDVVSDRTAEGDQAATALVAEACRGLREDGSDAVVAQLRRPSRFVRSLRANGFWRIPGKHAAYRPITFKRGGVMSQQPYHFTGGDFDMG